MTPSSPAAMTTMKTLRFLGISALALAALSGTAQAHEKWFYEGPEQPLRWDLYFQAATPGVHGGRAGRVHRWPA